MNIVGTNRSTGEFRKQFWQAVHDLKTRGKRALIILCSIDPKQMCFSGDGILVREKDRSRYCDGRVPAMEFCFLQSYEDGRPVLDENNNQIWEKILFIPLEDEQDSRVSLAQHFAII